MLAPIAKPILHSDRLRCHRTDKELQRKILNPRKSRHTRHDLAASAKLQVIGMPGFPSAGAIVAKDAGSRLEFTAPQRKRT
jgi:hypothetical protein